MGSSLSTCRRRRCQTYSHRLQQPTVKKIQKHIIMVRLYYYPMVGLLKNNGMHEKYELPSGKHFAFGIRRSWVQTLVLSGRLCVLELALNMHSLSLLKGKNITKLQEVYFTRVALYMYCLHKS